MLPPFAVCLVIGLVLWAAWKDPRVPLAGRLVWWARQWGYEIIGAIVALAVIGPVVTFLLVSTFIALWRLPDDPRTWAGVQRWRTAPTRAKRISGTAAYVALTTHANLVQRVRRNHVRRTWRRSMRHCGVSGTRVRELERTPAGWRLLVQFRAGDGSLDLRGYTGRIASTFRAREVRVARVAEDARPTNVVSVMRLTAM
jgi:hypothetical protein